MNTKQLFKALENNNVTTKYFDGVYSLDTLKDIKTKPTLIICNTSPSTHDGEHWVVFFFPRKSHVAEFYDSLGNDMSFYGDEFNIFVNRFAHSYIFTKKATQPSGTSLCGVYCLFFCFWRCMNYSFENVLKKMTTAQKICTFVYRLFHIEDIYPCKLIQCCQINN